MTTSIPGNPFRAGERLDLDALARMHDLAGRTELLGTTGVGGSVGSGGGSVHAAQPLKFWVIVGENKDSEGPPVPASYYSWQAAYRNNITGQWEAYDQFQGGEFWGGYDDGLVPLIEIYGNEEVPEGYIAEATLGDDGNSLYFLYIPSTGDGTTTTLNNVTLTYNNSTINLGGTTTTTYGPYTSNIYQGAQYYPVYNSTLFTGGSVNNWTIPAGNVRIGVSAEEEYFTITSIDPGPNPHGRVICLHNVGERVILLEHQSASGDASKRILVGNGPDYFYFAPGHEVTLVYDDTNTVKRWRVSENSECRLVAWEVYSPFTGDQDDWEPVARAHTHYVSSSGGTRRITGMAGGVAGLRRRIVNYDTTDSIVLGHEDTDSLATSRFSLPRNVDFWLRPGQCVDTEWSGGFERWFIVSPPLLRVQYDGGTGIVETHTLSLDPAYFDLTEPDDGEALLTILPGTVVAALTDTYIGYGNAADELTGSADLIRTAAGQIQLLGIGNPATQMPAITTIARRAASADLQTNDQAAVFFFQGRANSVDDDLAYLLVRYTGSGTTHTGDIELWGVEASTPNLGLTVLGSGDVIVENADTVDKLLGTNASNGAVININVGSGLSYDSGTATLSASGGSASLTQYRIGYGSAANLLTGSSSFTYDDAAVVLLKVPSPGGFRVEGYAGASTSLAKFLGGHADGSGGSPSTTSDGRILARLGGVRYDGGWQSESAMMDFVAANTSLADIIFRTGSTTSPTDRLSILNSGEIRCHGLTASRLVYTDGDKDLSSVTLDASLTLTGATLSVTNPSSGTNTGDQTITLTGDVTGSGTGSFAATIGANKVTFAKIQAITDGTLLGASGGTAVKEITPTLGIAFSGNNLIRDLIGCKVYASSATSISNAAYTSIAWDGESWDTDSFHDNATNNTRVTIPASMGGKYRLTGIINLVFDSTISAATGMLWQALHSDGTTVLAAGSGFVTQYTTCFVIVGEFSIAAAEYFVLQLFQNTGSARNTSTSVNGAWIAVERIGD